MERDERQLLLEKFPLLTKSETWNIKEQSLSLSLTPSSLPLFLSRFVNEPMFPVIG